MEKVKSMVNKKLKLVLFVVVILAIMTLVFQYRTIQTGAFSLGYKSCRVPDHSIKKPITNPGHTYIVPNRTFIS